MNAFSKLTLATLMACVASVASAQQGAHAGHGSHESHAGHEAAAKPEPVDGEVKKIDKDAGKITLRHGELKNLNMPAMSMVFRVQDPAMLDLVKVGDKVKFAADRVNGAVTVVQMEKAQ